jgi:integrase
MLSDAIQEFLAYRRSAGFANNTLLSNQRGTSALLALIGNIQVRHLDARHGELFQAYLMGKGYKPNTVNAYLTTLAALTKWLRSRKYLGGGSDPTANIRQVRAMVEPRQRLDQDEFMEFLSMAQTPHERIVCALGLFLFLRASEVAAIKVGDIDLDEGVMLVHVEKSKIVDTMPICSELDAEIRQFLAWYTQDIGKPLSNDMFFVPRRRRPAMANDGSGPGGGYMVKRDHDNCLPYQKLNRPHRYVQRVLRRFGIPLRDEEGKSLMEGCHTLRRSGARALFDELVNERSYDGALRLVSAMLHHKSTQMTERYLGLDVDVKKRNDLLRGIKMFTYAEDIIQSSDNITRIEA